MTKIRPWIVTADFNPDAMRLDRDDLRSRVAPAHRQMNLFDAASSALTGEV